MTSNTVKPVGQWIGGQYPPVRTRQFEQFPQPLGAVHREPGTEHTSLATGRAAPSSTPTGPYAAERPGWVRSAPA